MTYQKHSNPVAGILIGGIGVIMFSSKAIMAKLAYQYTAEPITLLLWRMLFALPAYLIFLYRYWKRGHYNQLSKQDIGGIILLGLAGYYLASFLDFTGLKYIPASIERLIIFLYPTFVVILSAIFTKNKITPGQAIAILITYAGLFLIYGFGSDSESDSMMFAGSVMVLLAALSYAAYLTGSQTYIERCGAPAFTSLAMVVSSIAVIIHQLITSGNIPVDLPAPVFGYTAAMAVIATIIPSYLIAASIQRIGAPVFSIIGSIGPVSTIILAYIILGESLSTIQISGGAVIILGVILVSKEKYAQAKRT